MTDATYGEESDGDWRRFRALFLSDVHLGSRATNAELLVDFLRYHDAPLIYLVGDIVDGWRLKRSWHWPQSHNDVVQKILRCARKGARVIYIPGNHDEFARDFQGKHFGGVEVVDRTMHESATGRKFLVIHGDQFDVVVMNARTLAYLGDWAYDIAVRINRTIAVVRRLFNLPYWSFSAWAKLRVKEAVNFIGSFQTTLSEEARKSGADGVICGHIHHATIAEVDGITYINTGDWVESCTAIGENFDGTFEILSWTSIRGPKLPTAIDVPLREIPAPLGREMEAA
jgi:UDP-2,3-diacylglucosamine pyrophosphatase LpxH